MNKETKPFLTVPQQIEHLKSKGISFEIMDEQAATKYLSSNNNFFRVRSYRKNYPISNEGANAGKYVGLDFAMLCELGTIDMHLRYTLIQIALNAEHFLKVKLLRKFEEYGEDGYSIISDYFDYLKTEDEIKETKYYKKLEDELSRNQDNPYCGGIIYACCDGYSTWAFVEVISLGTLLSFYRFCASKYNDKDMKNDFHLMTSVKKLRNACAHNNCILNDLRSKDSTITPDLNMLNKLKSNRRSTIKKKLKNERVLEIVTLLYTHKKLASSEANAGIYKLLKQLLDRMVIHKDYFKNNNMLVSYYEFFHQVIDILYQ